MSKVNKIRLNYRVKLKLKRFKEVFSNIIVVGICIIGYLGVLVYFIFFIH